MFSEEKKKELLSKSVAIKDRDYGNFKFRMYYTVHENSDPDTVPYKSIILQEAGKEEYIEFPFIPEMYIDIAKELHAMADSYLIKENKKKENKLKQL